MLDNLSLKIRPGQYVAIAGKSGCGKSALMRILPGFETPQKGAAYYDGIVRAVAPRPKILIMDEAIGALDNVTQKKISDALGKSKSTRIVIAHRLSTIRRCDRIIVLEQGRIIEDGTYDQLMKQNGFVRNWSPVSSWTARTREEDGRNAAGATDAERRTCNVRTKNRAIQGKERHESVLSGTVKRLYPGFHSGRVAGSGRHCPAFGGSRALRIPWRTGIAHGGRRRGGNRPVEFVIN